jgi:hypothetical protein
MVSQSNLKSDLIALFEEMEKAPMSLTDYAGKWSKLLAEHITTAEIAAGTFVVDVVGDAAGIPNPAPVNVQ